MVSPISARLGWDIRSQHAQYVLYFVTRALLLICILFSQWLLRQDWQDALAMRDKEDRVRFSGYDVRCSRWQRIVLRRR